MHVPLHQFGQPQCITLEHKNPDLKITGLFAQQIVPYQLLKYSSRKDAKSDIGGH